MVEETSISAQLVSILEERRGELHVDLVRRVQEALAASRVPEGLEELLESMLGLWSRLANQIIERRIKSFLEGSCNGVGIDVDVCLFLRRLMEAYKAMLLGQLIVDDAGRAYIKLLKTREIRGRVYPRGTVLSLELGVALLLYAIGDAEIASIKPLKGGWLGG